jgi:hypothetical protein
MTHDPKQNPEVRFEKKDVNEWSTFWFGVVILAVMVVTAFLTRPLYELLAEHETATQPAPDYVAEADPAALELHGPRLQVEPEVDLATLRAQEDAILTSYAWVDKEHAVARIPVEEAMRIVAERGLPDFPSPAGDERAEEATQ